MCGIVGRAGSLALADERVFKVMLLLDYFRGQDSTGVAAVTKKGSVTTLKTADDPIMLFKNKDYEEVIAGVYDSIWIGHNRAATIGATSRENAHPFTCGHITGVHNGTLTKESFTALQAWVSQDYDTDSQTIFQHIATHGVDTTIPRLQGAWALVWYDAKDQTLNMIRNDQRPLYLSQTKRGANTILSWASEYEMIAAAREMAGAKDTEEFVKDAEGFAFFPLEIDTLHTWSLEQILWGDFEPTKRSLAGRPKPVIPTAVKTMGTPYVPPVYTEKKDTYSVIHVDGELEDEEKLVLGEFTREQWDDLTGYGCACCGADVDEADEGLLVCVNEGVVLCPKCSEVTKTTITNSYTHQLAAAL